MKFIEAWRLRKANRRLKKIAGWDLTDLELWQMANGYDGPPVEIIVIPTEGDDVRLVYPEDTDEAQ